MKHVLPAIRIYLFFTVLFGLAYPLGMTILAQVAFPAQAGGSLVGQEGRVIGSTLIAQKFTRPEYFWSRPSAVDFNALASGGSNWGQISADLKKLTEDRANLLKAAGGADPIPQDLIFASGSGLDPHISPEAAVYQEARVARARQLAPARVHALVEEHTSGRQFGLFGEPTVNVLALNLALDRETAKVR